MVARAYGQLYDAVVDGYAPFEALVDAVATLIESEAPGGPGTRRILDAACGTGAVSRRLAARGHLVVGLEAFPPLVQVARRATAGMPRVSVHAHDGADPGTPGEGTYDAVVSMNTLYWHSRPQEVLAACRRALRPGGLAVVLTYARPAHVLPVARCVFREHGVRAALNALRWLVPTALFERARAVPRRYCSAPELRERLADAGFAVVGMRPAFLGGIMHLAWARPVGVPPPRSRRRPIGPIPLLPASPWLVRRRFPWWFAPKENSRDESLGDRRREGHPRHTPGLSRCSWP
jgi:SAM-dependent methyltransferase